MRIPSIALSLLAIAGNAHADLPMLDDEPWIGSFIAFKDKDARFLLSSKGSAVFVPLKKDGSPIAITNPIKVEFEITETLPDGKSTRKKIDDDAFSSESPATLNPEEPITIQGTVTGGAKFEITVKGGKNTIGLSGRITDKGTITNPLHLSISIGFAPYKTVKLDNEKKQKAFAKNTKRDEIKLDIPGSQSTRLDFLDTINPAEKVPNGFSAAEIRTEGYGALRWNLTASPNSILRFEDTRLQPLWNGFTITWEPKKDADPAAEIFTIEHN